MSEANIGLTLTSNNLRDTSYIDSSMSQTIISEEASADSTNLRDTSYIDSSMSQTIISEEASAHSTNYPETQTTDPQLQTLQTTAPKTWEEGLRQLGREFAEIRQAQGMSTYQLHAQTFVPLHIIKALESGDLTRLPEKIYVQGFMRRMGDALGLDGSQLVASLPVDDTINACSQSRRTSSPLPLYLTRFHLYLVYIALLIAAVSGLSWMSNETPQETSAEKFTNRVTESETSRPEKPSIPQNSP